MSLIYNELKHGHKVSIGLYLKKRIESISDGFRWSEEFKNKSPFLLFRNIIEEIKEMESISNAINQKEYPEYDVIEFEFFLRRRKLSYLYDRFLVKEVTPRQLKYYLQLCESVGEEVEDLGFNYMIIDEISRLEKLKEGMEEDGAANK